MPTTQKKPSPKEKSSENVFATFIKAFRKSSSREEETDNMIADAVTNKVVDVVESTPTDYAKWTVYTTLGTASSAASAKQQEMYKASLLENEALNATNTQLESDVEDLNKELKNTQEHGTKNLYKAQNWHNIALKLGEIIYKSAVLPSNLISSVTLKQLHTSKKDELERKLTTAELDGLIRITPNATPNVATGLKNTMNKTTNAITDFLGMKKGGTKRQKIQRRRKTRKYRI